MAALNLDLLFDRPKTDRNSTNLSDCDLNISEALGFIDRVDRNEANPALKASTETSNRRIVANKPNNTNKGTSYFWWQLFA
jgi:hypothetical protein